MPYDQTQAMIDLCHIVARLRDPASRPAAEAGRTCPRNRFGKLELPTAQSEAMRQLGRIAGIPNGGTDHLDQLAMIAQAILAAPAEGLPGDDRSTVTDAMHRPRLVAGTSIGASGAAGGGNSGLAILYVPRAPAHGSEEEAATLDYWRGLIGGVTRGMTAEQVEEAAQLCVAAQRAGRPIGAWHAASTVLGTLASCPCQPCATGRLRHPVIAGDRVVGHAAHEEEAARLLARHYPEPVRARLGKWRPPGKPPALDQAAWLAAPFADGEKA